MLKHNYQKYTDMKRDFEINGEYRVMDNAELVYILTNSEHIVNKVKEDTIKYGENCDINTILNQMTPARKKVAMAGIELYKR